MRFDRCKIGCSTVVRRAKIWYNQGVNSIAIFDVGTRLLRRKTVGKEYAHWPELEIVSGQWAFLLIGGIMKGERQSPLLKVNANLPQPEDQFIRLAQQALLEPLAQYMVETIRRGDQPSALPKRRRMA